MVVAPGPSFSVADVYQGWVRALQELGCEVFPFNLDARINIYSAVEVTIDGETRKAFSQEAAYQLTMESLYAECWKFWPDVVVIVSGFMVGGEAIAHMQKRGYKVVQICTESPYEDITQIERAAQPDLVILNDPTNLDRFKAANANVYFEGHSYDPLVHFPGPATPALESDFAFVGTGYPSRISFLEAVDWTGIDVVLGGYWRSLTEDSPLMPFLGHDPMECVDNAEAVNVYRSTLMSANLYRASGLAGELEAERAELTEGWAMGPREIELAATGCPYITQARGENREVLPMVPTFSSPEEFGDLLRFYINNEDARTAVAGAARAAVEHRTFKNAAARMLRAVDRLPVSA